MPFHAFLTVWGSSLLGHYTILRLWKELIIFGLLFPASLYFYVSDLSIRSKLKNNRIQQLIIFYILIHLIIGIWAINHHEVRLKALAYSFIVNLRIVVFFWTCLVITLSNNFISKHWRKILLVPAGIVILFGLVQHFMLPLNFLSHFGYGDNKIAPYQTVDQNSQYARIQSTLRGANPLGAYLVLILSGLTVVYLKTKRILLNRFVLAIVASVLVLFYTYSRSAWIGSLIAVSLTVWLSVKTKIRWYLTAAIALLVILGGLSVLGLRNNTRFEDTFFHTSNQSKSSTSSNYGHKSAIIQGLKDIEHRPLGGGPGSAGPASAYNYQPNISENYFVQIGQEVGVEGLLVFLLLNLLIASELYKNRTDELSMVLLGSLVGISFVGLLSHVWTDDTLGLIWWGLAGCAVAPGIINTKITNKNETQITKKTSKI
jgi:hypothetical protein